MKKLFILMLLAFMFVSCGIESGGSVSEMTPKQKMVAAYGTYNSQYALYMSDTGYVLKDGEWEKVREPVLSDDKKEILIKKKVILTQVYPLLKIYDSMVSGEVAFSSATEAELFSLLDQLALLVI